MTRRGALLAMGLLGSLLVVVLAVFAILAFARVNTLVHDESVQRVHTIGERCETTRHQLAVLETYLPASDPQVRWFVGSLRSCHVSLAKVEARAGTHYKP